LDERPHLQSLKRGLHAVALINSLGSITVAELARRLSLPRTNAERILLTLLDEDYVERDPVTKAFFLTHRVHSLSDGYMVEDRIARIAKPFMEQATREIGWPVLLAMPRGEQMSVRVTTDPLTTLHLNQRHIGSEVQMGMASSGIVFLAYLEETQRALMLEMLRRSDDPLQAAVHDEERITYMLKEARRDGYSFGFGYGRERSVAVPILAAGQIKAVLLMAFMASVLSNDEVVEAYVPRLKTMADAVAKAIIKTRQDDSRIHR
jgi:IclR family mhp operon transcriptional activator